MPSSEKVIVDTYAWTEYFRGSEKGEKVKEFVEGNYSLLTPSIVIAELSDKYRRQDKKEDWQTRKHFVRLKSDITKLDYKIAEKAGNTKQEMREKHKGARLADAIIASHAGSEEAKIITGDAHLIDREETVDISEK